MKLVECIRVVAFDLDGTLVDTAPDLADAANAMLGALGYGPLTQKRIERHIGGGIERLAAAALAESAGRAAVQDELTAAIALFRSSYATRLFTQSRVYPDVIEGLRSLAAAGVELACVTNKESTFTRPLLDAAGLGGWFARVLCADRPEQRKPAPHLLTAACEHFGISSNKLVYVGDSQNDIAAARSARCAIAVVDYGYSHGISLAQACPDWVIGSIGELMTLPASERYASRGA